MDEPVRTQGQGFRTLGSVPEGETGNVEHRGFYLDPAGIGKHESSIINELDHVKIPHRFDKVYGGNGFEGVVQVVIFEAFGRPGMHREDQVGFFRHFDQQTDDLFEVGRHVHVVNPMHGNQPVLTGFYPNLIQRIGPLSGQGPGAQQAVDHGVADQTGLLPLKTFLEKVLHRHP